MFKISKKITLLILILLSLLILIYIKCQLKFNTYDINKSLLSYNLKEDEYKAYCKYIANYIMPKELKKFVKYDALALIDYNENATGYDVLDYITYKAYIEMFNSLFENSLIDYNKFPLTKNFIEKFTISPHEYFNLKGDKVNCHIDQSKKELIIEDYKEDENEEYEYLYYCYFTYKINDDGLIDDIILNDIK